MKLRGTFTLGKFVVRGFNAFFASSNGDYIQALVERLGRICPYGASGALE